MNIPTKRQHSAQMNRAARFFRLFIACSLIVLVVGLCRCETHR